MKKIGQFIKDSESLKEEVIYENEKTSNDSEYDLESYKNLDYNIPDKDFKELAKNLNKLVADGFRFYVKLKGVHWHIKGSDFYQYHTLLDEHAAQVLATIDPIAERVRTFNMDTIINLNQVSGMGGLKPNNSTNFGAITMLGELLDDNIYVMGWMRYCQNMADKLNDGATSNLLQGFIEQAELRKYFLQSITGKY